MWVDALANGIVGTTKDEVLSVIGAPLQVKGTAGSVVGLYDLDLKYCALASGYDWVSADNCVKKAGAVATDNVTFEPWHTVTVTPVEKGSGHFTLSSDKSSDVFTDKGYFEEGAKVSIVAEPEEGFVFGHWTDDANWKDTEKRMDETRKPADKDKAETYTMTAADKEFSALFYFVPATGATWYGLNDGKVVSFDFSDNCEKAVNPKKTPSFGSVSSGDYKDGEGWYLANSGNLINWEEFEGGFDKDTEYDTKTPSKVASIVSGTTDMSYDLINGDMWAVKGSDLYRLEGSEFKKIAAFKYKDADVAITCIAVDASSTMFALGSGAEGKLYTVTEVNEEDKKAVLALVGGDPEKDPEVGKIGVAVTTDAQSMAFDHVSGDLIWGAPDYVRVISLDNAKAHIAGDLGQKAGAQGVIKALHRMDITVTVQAKVADDCKEMGTVAIGSGKGGLSVKETFIEGNNATLNATPAAGFKFVKWTIKNGTKETDLKKDGDKATITVNASNTVYIAYFEESDEGLDDIKLNGDVRKVMIDGTIYIIRESGIYTVTGAKVK